MCFAELLAPGYVGTSQCDLLGCSNSCTILPNHDPICFCPNGSVIGNDSKTCKGKISRSCALQSDVSLRSETTYHPDLNSNKVVIWENFKIFRF